MYIVRPVAGEAELERILALQQRNLARNLDPTEVASQGFVTVEHTLDVLRRMHAIAPSIVALDGDKLAGYALVMPPECRAFVPVLVPMFERLDHLQARDYYIMGQICIDKRYRGHGLFDEMYAAHKRYLSDRYRSCITEVATRNVRSMNAHLRVGFTIMEKYRDATDEWALLEWRWSQ
jgi:ribosomal protein S18 acetylase RimI-like enzyme